jgi:hypothetical protein
VLGTVAGVVDIDGGNSPSGFGVYDRPEDEALVPCGLVRDRLMAYPNGRTFNWCDFISRSSSSSDFVSSCAMRASSSKKPELDIKCRRSTRKCATRRAGSGSTKAFRHQFPILDNTCTRKPRRTHNPMDRALVVGPLVE